MQVYQNEDDEDLQSEFIRKLHPVTKLVLIVAAVAATLITLLIIK